MSEIHADAEEERAIHFTILGDQIGVSVNGEHAMVTIEEVESVLMTAKAMRDQA